ncbi:MAG: heparinase II/III-family protein, partial [Gammaproteobacteria bacterium]
YQPGHTHCDFLSYELAFDDQMIVVDAGVFEYTEGEMRDYVRSTQAHNTISVDGDQQSEIWAAFRVARRASKLYAQVARNARGASFKGGYQGFYAVRGKAKHLRDVDMQLTEAGNAISRITIKDVVQFKGKHQAESFIHLHPSLSCQDDGSGTIGLMQHGELVANVILARDTSYKISTSYYCPEFGKRIENPVITMTRTGLDNIEMGYVIEKL